MKKAWLSAICLAAAPLVAHAQWGLAHLHDFTGTDGAWTTAPSTLMKAADGNYYGVTYQGGTNGKGVMYKMVITGTQVSPSTTYTVLHNFYDGTVTNDGAFPTGAMVQDASGSFYGVAYGGGAASVGMIFRYNPTTGYTVMHSFNDGTTSQDGQRPSAGLTIDASGNIYGITTSGGSHGFGTIFKLSQSGGIWTYSIIYNFVGSLSCGSPDGTLTLGLDGNLYGVSSGAICAFQFNPSTHAFVKIGAPVGDPGYNGLIENPNSYASGIREFFGTTALSGANSKGTIYKFTETAHNSNVFTYSLVHTFAGGSLDGNAPYGNLLWSTDNGGSFYGTTYSGGGSNAGMLFNITTGGTFSSMRDLTGNPREGVIWGNIGGTSVLIGTSRFGGASNYGFVWEAYII